MLSTRQPLLLLLPLLVLLLCRVSAAQICYVSPTGNPSISDCTNPVDPCRDFKFAIESATPNCTEVRAYGGLYTGANNTNINTSPPLIIRGITGTVVVDLQGSGRFIRIGNSPVNNFTFEVYNIQVRNGFTSTGGAAISVFLANTVALSASPPFIFQNVTLVNNVVMSTSAGGGALHVRGPPAHIINSVIRGNRLICDAAGAVSCNGGGVRFGPLSNTIAGYVVENSLFEDNEVLSIGDSTDAIVTGGGLSIGSLVNPVSVNVTIRYSSFINNVLRELGVASDETNGGALFATEANITIECDSGAEQLCTFSGNRLFSAATIGIRDRVVGAAVAVVKSSANTDNTTQLTIHNALFYNNSVDCNDTTNCATQYGGGAVAASRISISGNSFCNNSAIEGSGAHILVLASAETPLLAYGPLSNSFTCNNSGPAIEPSAFSCGPPFCLFPSAVVDPATEICSPCQIAATGRSLISFSAPIPIRSLALHNR